MQVEPEKAKPFEKGICVDSEPETRNLWELGVLKHLCTTTEEIDPRSTPIDDLAVTIREKLRVGERVALVFAGVYHDGSVHSLVRTLAEDLKRTEACVVMVTTYATNGDDISSTAPWTTIQAPETHGFLKKIRDALVTQLESAGGHSEVLSS